MKALMIVTSHARLGETGNPTGLFMSELSHPHDVFRDSGFTVDVASPAGGDAPVDPNSLTDDSLKSRVSLARDTRALTEVRADDYDVLFLVGGHGTMYDLPDNDELQRLLTRFDADDKVIASVCHGQAGLVNAKRTDGRYLVAGRDLTAFSNAEEDVIGLTGVVPFPLQDRLVERGARYQSGEPWAEHVVTDGNLVTGQNPASAGRVAERVCSLLAQRIPDRVGAGV